MTGKKKKFLPYLITFFAAILIAFLVIKYESAVLSRSVAYELFSQKRKISDGCFVSGALVLSFGSLIALGEHGGLDALKYAVWKLKERIIHPKEQDRGEGETYYDYVKQREARQKSPFAHFLAIGALFLLVSLAIALF